MWFKHVFILFFFTFPVHSINLDVYLIKDMYRFILLKEITFVFVLFFFFISTLCIFAVYLFKFVCLYFVSYIHIMCHCVWD